MSSTRAWLAGVRVYWIGCIVQCWQQTVALLEERMICCSQVVFHFADIVFPGTQLTVQTYILCFLYVFEPRVARSAAKKTLQWWCLVSHYLACKFKNLFCISNTPQTNVKNTDNCTTIRMVRLIMPNFTHVFLGVDREFMLSPPTCPRINYANWPDVILSLHNSIHFFFYFEKIVHMCVRAKWKYRSALVARRICVGLLFSIVGSLFNSVNQICHLLLQYLGRRVIK